MIEPLTRPAVLQKVATIAAELDQLRKTNPELVGAPTASLRAMSTDVLCDRYWHLWLCNNPSFGVPRRLRATPDKSPRTRQVKAVRKNEMLRIARIVTKERQETLNMGAKYQELFQPRPITVVQTEPKTTEYSTVLIPTADLVPA